MIWFDSHPKGSSEILKVERGQKMTGGHTLYLDILGGYLLLCIENGLI